MDRGRYFVAARGGITFIKMVGNLKYTESSGFDLYLDTFLQEEYCDVVIDLSEATFLDSTNLGMIARIAERARRLQQGPVTLISPKDDINRILKSVRFDRIFRILERADFEAFPEERELVDQTCAPGETDDLRMILRAHRSLMDLDEANRAEFQDVVELLEKEAGVTNSP